MKELSYATIIRYLLICIENRIALDPDNVYEWARLMGYPVSHNKAHILAGNIPAAGRRLNQMYGRDVIAENWPQWATNPNYVSGL